MGHVCVCLSVECVSEWLCMYGCVCVTCVVVGVCMACDE